MDRHATDFELKEVVLESITGDNIDLVLLVTEINVYENLFNSSITADFVINDALNTIKNLPITGHE